MTKDRLTVELQALERKVVLLINNYKSLKEETDNLRDENQHLRSLVKIKEDQISNFQNKLKIVKIVDNMVETDGSSTELKQIINDYIKEIDKCLAHLSE